jgi:putative ATP-dependent endonuclease of OLD family
MARIRRVQIENFRGIVALDWLPEPGINCLIGPGDSGKSSILEAIDLCLGARRTIQFTDADFHQLNVEQPIVITVTMGELDDELKDLESYGLYLRGFNGDSGTIEDEPEKDLETVLSLRLTVASDLEPVWTLVSDRAEAQGQSRNLNWSDRVRLAPTRLGLMADYHLGWRRGSVLNRVSDERADASTALVQAAREARRTFGDSAQDQLKETLGIVASTAKELGIPVGDSVSAMLDAHSISFSGGTISLHSGDGIPLRGLGVGSTRLLIAGLQRRAAQQSTVILVDELEHGLEPHRIIRLLGSLGAKEKQAPLQVFMTTHSPVALRELSGNQLFVVRRTPDGHKVLVLGTSDDIQSTIRLYPDAFLATSVIVCEGACEVGLLRGLDQFRVANEEVSISAHGVALVDCGGGEPDRPFTRASAFRALGYRVAVLRDDDVHPTPAIQASSAAAGGKEFSWGTGRTLEDTLFLSLSEAAVYKLLDKAIDLHGKDLIDDHIKSASKNSKSLGVIQSEQIFSQIEDESRSVLGKAARTKKAGWFKSVSWMEEPAREIVGPDLPNADSDFVDRINNVIHWASDASA